MTGTADYTTYSLRQLLMARYWFDADTDSTPRRQLEEEIQNRCAHFPEPTQRKGSAGSASRYRLYGLRAGVFSLVISSGPFIAVNFLNTMNFITDVNGDNSLLPAVWGLFTLPFAVMVFMIGGIMDAERVVKWLNL